MATHEARLACLREKHGNGNGAGTPLAVAVRTPGWPTPCAATNRKSARALLSSEDNGRRSGGGRSSPPGLEQAVEMSLGVVPKELEGVPDARLPAATRAYWPTPNAQGGTGYMSGSARDTWRPTLEGAARMAPEGPPPVIVAEEQRAARERWLTPQAHDAQTTWLDAGKAIARAEVNIASGNGVQLANQVGGSLNPDWVERLMAWPDGWTRPGPLAPGALAAWLARDWPAEWASGAWEAGVPRVAVGVKHRVARLRALGNGWVPLQAAVAIRGLIDALAAMPTSCGADLLTQTEGDACPT